MDLNNFDSSVYLYTYNDQIINVSKNSIEILENVHYTNENIKMFADIVEIDLLKNKLKISMKNRKNKILISEEN